MMSQLKNVTFEDIPKYPEDNYLNYKSYGIASFAILFFSSVISLSFFVLLKYQQNHTAFYDSPSGGIRAVFSFVPDKANMIASFSIFAGFSIAGITSLVVIVKKKNKQNQAQNLTKKFNYITQNQNNAEKVYKITTYIVATIVTAGSLLIFTTFLTLHSLSLKKDIHITNQSVIDRMQSLFDKLDPFFKRRGGVTSWKDLLPQNLFSRS